MKRLALAVLLMLLMTDASACSCFRLSLKQQLDQASLVMLVRVVETRLDVDSLKSVHSAGPVRAKFELAETLKGESKGKRELASWYGGGDCGVILQPGIYYLVVSNPKDAAVVSLNTCSGTMEFGASDPRGKAVTIGQLQLEAAREYLRSQKPIDPCLNEYSPSDLWDKCSKLMDRLTIEREKSVNGVR